MPVFRWVGVVSLTSMVACSERPPADRAPASNEPSEPLTHSVAGDSAVSEVQSVFASGAARLPAAESVLRDIAPTPTFALPASDASGFAVLDDGTIRLDAADASRIRSRVDVHLPLSAGGEFELALAEPSMRVRVSLQGARGDVTATTAEGYVVYPDALGAGRHVLHRVVASGTEDYVLFPEAPSVPRLTYNIALDENTAGLRLVNNTLEILDDEGTPRLRVSPPYVATSDGRSEAATLSIEGCAYDTSPAAPWGRTPTLANSDHCTVAVSWSATSYPLVVDPAWTDTGDMSVSRQEMDMVRLGGASSNVLVAGGGPFIGIGSSPLQSAELYDPSTGTWGATGAMTVGRADFTLTAIGPNEVLAVGGLREFTGFGTYEATSEIYNVTSGTWTQTADTMSEPRAVHAAARLASGQVLVTGGQNPNLMVGVELFDPADGSWTTRANMSVPRRFHTASVVNAGGVEKVLIVGSQSGVLAAELYDPATDVWQATAPMGMPRARHAATVLTDGTVLVTGGADGFLLNSLASAEVYDPDQNLWTSTANDMPVARQFHSATLRANGSVLIAGGGLQSATIPIAVLRASELYDVGTRSFTSAPSLSVARRFHDAVLLDDQNVLIAGGAGTSIAGDPYVLLDPINGGPATTQASAELFGQCGNGQCEPNEFSCGCPQDCGVDTDGDGLSDIWETSGVDIPGVPPLDLAALGANPNRKDVFLEIDYMDGGPADLHRPPQKWIDDLVAAFANAPVSNPDGSTGVTLHVDLDEALPHHDVISFYPPGSASGPDFVNFYDVKASHFDPARRAAFHYGVFGHTYNTVGFGVPGAATRGGTDIIWAFPLSHFTTQLSVPAPQSGMMHELGHNLGLDHGGAQELPNYKPNYLSVMNYYFDYGIPYVFPDGRYDLLVDYSRSELARLKESSLDEPLGISPDPGVRTYHSCPDSSWTQTTGGAIDWNCNDDFSEVGVPFDVNHDNGLTELEGHDDWSNLTYAFQCTPGFGNALAPPPAHLVIEEIGFPGSQACATASECQSGVCAGGSCSSPTCNDGMTNGSETAVDCGGSMCTTCGDHAACDVDADCASGVCASGFCESQSSCSDGVKNGSETDLDCGGQCHKKCAVGKGCATAADCRGHLCLDEVCAPASLHRRSP